MSEEGTVTRNEQGAIVDTNGVTIDEGSKDRMTAYSDAVGNAELATAQSEDLLEQANKLRTAVEKNGTQTQLATVVVDTAEAGLVAKATEAQSDAMNFQNAAGAAVQNSYEHYSENKAAYQEHAAEDAQAKGYDVQFGGEQPPVQPEQPIVTPEQ